MEKISNIIMILGKLFNKIIFLSKKSKFLKLNNNLLREIVLKPHSEYRNKEDGLFTLKLILIKGFKSNLVKLIIKTIICR